MRLVVTFAIGGMPWADASIASMRDYASKMGADFHEVKWFPDYSGKYNGNPVWAFVDFLKRFREQDYYKEVLVLDCDVLILPSCPDLFEMEGGLVCALDQAWPTKDDRYKEWVAKHYPDSTENARGVDDDPYFNAGVLLFRLEALRALNFDPPYPDEMGYDQDFLNMRTAEAGIDITWVGEEYNQRNVSQRQEALAINHILHLVGGGKERLMEYADFLGIWKE